MKEYAVVFEKTETGWSAYAPDLPGLGVAGTTFEETEQLIREGIAFHIDYGRTVNRFQSRRRVLLQSVSPPNRQNLVIPSTHLSSKRSCRKKEFHH